MGSAAQTGVRDRHDCLSKLWRTLNHHRCNRRPPGHSEDPRPLGSAHPGSTQGSGQGRPTLSAGLSTPDPQLDPLPSRSTPEPTHLLALHIPQTSHRAAIPANIPCTRVEKPLLTARPPHFQSTDWRDSHPAASSVLFRWPKIAFKIPIPTLTGVIDILEPLRYFSDCPK